MNTSPLAMSIEFTERAKPYLAHAEGGALKLSGHLQLSALAKGDKVRFDSIERCPWFVVSERQWSIADGSSTLTIWLDEAD